ncbi:hypothetical protein B6K86_09070 [Lachnospiraceae bacterium]|jgi:hypothetical protein|nr:hypothetical protein B6K86_09070 [Lachnospiraceae bacterium]
MYNDKHIKINFSMPEELRQTVKLLDQYAEGTSFMDSLKFEEQRDNLEIYSKSAYFEKKISADQLDMLWRKYGMR